MSSNAWTNMANRQLFQDGPRKNVDFADHMVPAPGVTIHNKLRSHMFIAKIMSLFTKNNRMSIEQCSKEDVHKAMSKIQQPACKLQAHIPPHHPITSLLALGDL